MTNADTDLYRAVEYGRERYLLNRVPLALLGCAAGLFMLAMDPGPPGMLPLVALVVLLAIGSVVAIASLAWDYVIDVSNPRWIAGLVVALVLGVALLFALPPRYHRSSALDPSFRTLGWMFIIFSLGFIGFALLKWIRPGRPLLTLSPAGLWINTSGLKNLLIPWYEVEHVGLLEHVYDSGVTVPFPNNPVVVVSQEFYEREIVPRGSFVSGSGWNAMFQPKRNQMQVLLPWPWFSVSHQDMLEPVDARWKAFREQPAARAPVANAPPLRMSAWSPAMMTRWQRTLFAMPAACVLLMLVHFGGLWDMTFLRNAREDFTQQRAHREAARESARKGEIIINGGQWRR